MDNLIAAKQATSMIVVVYKGYATDPICPDAGGPGFMAVNILGEVLVKEIIPMTEQHFRALTDWEH